MSEINEAIVATMKAASFEVRNRLWADQCFSSAVHDDQIMPAALAVAAPLIAKQCAKAAWEVGFERGTSPFTALLRARDAILALYPVEKEPGAMTEIDDITLQTAMDAYNRIVEDIRDVEFADVRGLRAAIKAVLATRCAQPEPVAIRATAIADALRKIMETAQIDLPGADPVMLRGYRIGVQACFDVVKVLAP